MKAANHYREAEDALERKPGSGPGEQQHLARAQLHALLAISDELRAIRNELIEIHGILDRNA
jgi:hypothetical protein